MAITNVATLQDLFTQCPVMVVDTYGYLGTAGATVDFLSLISAIAPSAYVDNGNGTITLTPGNGVNPVTIGPFGLASLTDDGNGLYTFNNGLGATQVIDTTQAPLASVVDNSDGTYTFSDGKGGVTLINALQPISVLTDNNNGTYTHDDGQGNLVTISTAAPSFKQVGNAGTPPNIAEAKDAGQQPLLDGTSVDVSLETNGVVPVIDATGQRSWHLRRFFGFARDVIPFNYFPPATPMPVGFNTVVTQDNITIDGATGNITALAGGIYMLNVNMTHIGSPGLPDVAEPRISVDARIDGIAFQTKVSVLYRYSMPTPTPHDFTFLLPVAAGQVISLMMTNNVHTTNALNLTEVSMTITRVSGTQL